MLGVQVPDAASGFASWKELAPQDRPACDSDSDSSKNQREFRGSLNFVARTWRRRWLLLGLTGLARKQNTEEMSDVSTSKEA